MSERAQHHGSVPSGLKPLLPMNFFTFLGATMLPPTTTLTPFVYRDDGTIWSHGNLLVFRWRLVGGGAVSHPSHPLGRSAGPRSDHPAFGRVSPAHQGQKLILGCVCVCVFDSREILLLLFVLLHIVGLFPDCQTAALRLLALQLCSWMTWDHVDSGESLMPRVLDH